MLISKLIRHNHSLNVLAILSSGNWESLSVTYILETSRIMYPNESFQISDNKELQNIESIHGVDGTTTWRILFR